MDSILLPSDQAELKKQKLKIIFLVVFSILISLSIFLYWTLKDYRYTWQALKAARVLSQKMQEMKTLAILKNEPLEFRFVLPDVVEVYSVSNCAFNSKKEKLYDFTLSEFSKDIVFVEKNFLKKFEDYKNIILTDRFCYDPRFGSSVHADGVSSSSVFLVSTKALKKIMNNQDYSSSNFFVEILIQGIDADIEVY
jgi:hypothetical protein